MSTEYGISPVDYWHRFKRNVEHHNATQDRAFLFYAALECRFTIEAVMFEYLRAVSAGELSRSQKKLYAAGDLRAAIVGIDPVFEAKLDFIEMCAYYGEEFRRFVKPDLVMMGSVYGRLGRYLHVQKKASRSRLERSFWEEFAKVLDEPARHIALVLSAPFMTIEFTDEANQMIGQYAAGKLNREQVRSALAMRWGLMFRSVALHIHEL